MDLLAFLSKIRKLQEDIFVTFLVQHGDTVIVLCTMEMAILKVSV